MSTHEPEPERSDETGDGGDEREKKAKRRKKSAKEERRRRKAERKAWKRARPRREPWVAPVLAVSDVDVAAAFYERAFDFEVEQVSEGADGKALHAVLRHRRGTIMLGAAKGKAIAAPQRLGGTSVALYVYVPDIDAFVPRAAIAGARVLRAPTDEPWGDRCARVADPEGHVWIFATHLRAKRRRIAEDAEPLAIDDDVLLALDDGDGDAAAPPS